MADYAAFPIIAIAFMTPAPLYFIFFISRCIICVKSRISAKNKKKEMENKKNEPESTPMMKNP